MLVSRRGSVVLLLVLGGCALACSESDAPESGPPAPASTAGSSPGTAGSLAPSGSNPVQPPGTAGNTTPVGGGPAGAGAGGSGAGGGGQSGSGTAGMPDASTTPPTPDAGTDPPGDAGTMEPMQPGAECAGDDGMDFALVGWAAQSGGTTGGKGGTAVTVSTGSALLQALAGKNAGTPLTIRVMGTITEANTGAEKIDVKDVQDVSIIGLGAGAELDGIGIKIFRASNVVVRNLKIHNVAIGDKDGISIEGPADHIWIDHCELYSVYPAVDKDFYDGLIDVKAEAEYITYSWNNLHDSWKTMLVGSSEDDTFDRKLTIHHNVFRNCNSRMPLFRGGNGHVFNNLYDQVADTGINARIGACLLIEANVFEHAKNPWVSAFSDELGAGELRCNMTSADTTFAYADDVHELPTCDANVPYDYAAALNHPSKVAAVVNAGAGVGKLTNPEQF